MWKTFRFQGRQHLGGGSDEKGRKFGKNETFLIFMLLVKFTSCKKFTIGIKIRRRLNGRGQDRREKINAVFWANCPVFFIEINENDDGGGWLLWYVPKW